MLFQMDFLFSKLPALCKNVFILQRNVSKSSYFLLAPCLMIQIWKVSFHIYRENFQINKCRQHIFPEIWNILVKKFLNNCEKWNLKAFDGYIEKRLRNLINK